MRTKVNDGEEVHTSGTLPVTSSPLLSAQLQYIRTYIADNYTPVENPQEAALHLSTSEIHSRLCDIFPAEGFTPALLFTWLIELGFRYRDLGEMKVEWLLGKPKVL